MIFHTRGVGGTRLFRGFDVRRNGNGDIRMSTTTDAVAAEGGSETETAGEQVQTFTQADVDRIVKERVQRVQAKFADYDEVKAKANESRSLEERLADVEKRYADAEAKALRSDVAARYGINAEDRDLFLTGADEDTLVLQAERLSARESERKKQGNVAPKEGDTRSTGKPEELETREFLKSLHGDAD